MTKRTTKNLSGTVLSQESFTYDKSSNLTQANGTALTYDAGNRLTSYNGNTLTYDADGNMLSDGSMVYEYDSANRLTKAGGNEYTYNAEDVRIRNLCGEYDTTYVYDTVVKLSRMLQKTTNGITTKYVYGRGLIGEEKECNVFKVYHFDYRGSTVAMTDMYGNVTDRFEYDTYGKMVSHVGDSFVIFGYNGRDGVVTDKNGLLYMRARYYNPTLCRFVNADVIHGEISNSVTLNRYAYANGNPVSFVDPFGLTVIIPPIPNVYLVNNPPAVYEDPELVEKAKNIGNRATISEGQISINMVEEEEEIDFLFDTLGEQTTCDLIAAAACDKYYEAMEKEFLLSDSCVSYEIKEHIIAYQWSIRARPDANLLALGYWGLTSWNALLDGDRDAFVQAWNRQKVYHATKSIDMRETDVRADGGWQSQASIFHYKEGIRDIYVGTERDPWATERK